MDIKKLKHLFWKKVSGRDSDKCWLWTACRHYKGYGEMGVGNGRKDKAHRISWIIHFGEIPDGLWVRQVCKNRLCCNPSHLFLSKNNNESDDWEERFWRKIQTGKKTECWPWIGKSRNVFGYGLFRRKWVNGVGRGKMVGSHIIAFELKNGVIEKGLFVLHKCDNPACCNPNHLFLGTQKDNVRDCIKKGRVKRCFGTRNPNSKMNEAKVLWCRKMFVPFSRILGSAALARRFGISESNMHGIVTGKAWKHVKF